MTGTAQAVAGQLLAGRYQLVAPLASGGMAQVWRGQDTALVRPVAIKVLHPHLATDEGFVARFRREAVAAARLSHPSIVAVYDTVSEGGIEAIVMELIEGRTLRAVLDEVGLLPSADVVDVGVQISDALDEAHRAGIVHRDIKPANIMISTDRRILVTDFGIAKAQKDADLTHTGTLLGTAKYLAPEQVVGDPVDPRADLYALGIVLYEAATGKPPFVADTDAATALARLQGPPPRARSTRSTIPVGLDEVIARSMARQPDHRFDRASTMKAALAGVDLADVRTDPSDLDSTQTGPTPAPGAGTSDGANSAAESSTAAQGPGVGGVPPLSGSGGDGGARAADPSAKVDRPPRRKATRAQHKAQEKARKQARRQARRRGGQRTIRTIAATLIIGGMLAAGVLLLTVLSDQGQQFDFAAPGIPVADVVTFDPQANGAENNDLALRAVDDDLETEWRTESYRFRPLSDLKDGVGLILELEDTTELEQIGLVTDSSDWSMEIYVDDGFGPNDDSFDPAELGTPAAVIDAGEGNRAVGLGGAEGSAILLWITDTGVTRDGEGDDSIERNRFDLYEVRLR